MSPKKVTTRTVAEALHLDSVSRRGNIFTVRQQFYYRHGRSELDLIERVRTAFPSAKILDNGEHDPRSWRPGSSVRHSSHWFVQFSITAE